MKGNTLRPVLISLIIALSLLIVALIVLPQTNKEVSFESNKPSPSKSEIPAKTPSPTLAVEFRPKLAIVIDDVGYAQSELPNFLALGVPLTFAILPGLKDSQRAAKEIARAGQAIILHQPLEPVGDEKPGPGLIKANMSQTQIEGIFDANVSELNISEGFNNHMGSKGTQDPALMSTLLGAAKKKHLYFLDSRTTDKTVSSEIALTLGLPFLARDVFLDDIKTVEAINEQLDLAIEIAKKKGNAIAIGHIYSDILVQVLKKKLPDISRAGVDLVYLRNLLPKEGL